MIRFLQVNTSKPINAMRTAVENMTRGMAISVNAATDEVSKGSGVVSYFVDVPKNYDGVNSMIEPTDDMFENIKADDGVLEIPVYPGERYAISAVTGTPAKGDKLVAEAGVLKKAAASNPYNCIYGGTYSDPTGIPMHIVEIVQTATA